MPKDVIGSDAAALKSRLLEVRRRSEDWARALSAEDLCVQTMPDVSPGKWHLAHVTWFWECFLLQEACSAYEEFDKRFNYLFNSYYEAIGARHARPERGFLTRPSIDEIYAYRAHVDGALVDWLDRASKAELDRFTPVLLTGFAHEEQHQELFLTDIKHVLSKQSFPESAFGGPRHRVSPVQPAAPNPNWVECAGGRVRTGHEGGEFAFDNESPAHDVLLTPFALADRPVTNAEFLAFIEDGGYRKPEHWLSDGWAAVCAQARNHPYYWRRGEEGWFEHTLHGLEPLDPAAPVCHVDYYEASAFADWTGYRLPDEREWEFAAKAYDAEAGRWAQPGGRLHPVSISGDGPLHALYGEVWEWTRSSYAPYPGFKAAAGAIGEYNGKFMCGQYVLRGGSAVSPARHLRATYRNFFPPDAQWQMTGLRLARDV